MKFGYKLIVYTFLLNVCAGLFISFTGWDVNFETQTAQELETSIEGLNQNPTQDPTVSQESTSIFDDFFGIQLFGWFSVISDFLNQYMFGMLDILLSIIPFETGQQDLLNSFLKPVLTFLYGFTILNFITGKEVN